MARSMQTMRGVVQRGAQRGRTLGYATINLPLEDSTVSGVYVARVYVKSETPYAAAVFADSARKIIEAHLLDFQEDLYGLEVTIELHEKIRDPIQFANDDALKIAIAGDVAKVRKYFMN